MFERSGQPVVTSWWERRESQLSFFHEKTQHDGTAQFVVNEVIFRDRLGQPVVIPQRGARPQQFIIGSDGTELEFIDSGIKIIRKKGEWSSAKRQKRYSMNVTEGGENHSIVWWMFMSVTMESAVFMRRNYLNNCQFHREYKRSQIKTNVRHIYKIGVWTRWELWIGDNFCWENHSWKFLSLIGEEWIINLQRTKVYVFSDSVLCLGKIHENTQSNDAWEQRLGWFKSSPEKKKLWQNRRWADGIRVEYFPRIQYVAAQWRSQMFAVEIRWDTREVHRKKFFHDNVQWYFLWIKRQWKRMLFKCQSRCSMCKDIWKRTMDIHWSWFWEKWYSIGEDNPQGEWDHVAERMLVELAESGCPIFRATSPLSRGRLKTKGHVKLSIPSAADLETIETFSHNCSANQLSLYGTVA